MLQGYYDRSKFSISLSQPCDKVETCLAFLYGTVGSRFDQDGYRVQCWLKALLCDHEANLGDFDVVLGLYRIGLDQDHQVTLLHVLYSYTPSKVEKSKVEQNYPLLAVSKPARWPIVLYGIQLANLILMMPGIYDVSERSLRHFKHGKKKDVAGAYSYMFTTMGLATLT